MPGCLLWCVRTDITCLWLTAVNWSNILAVCDMLCIMFCFIFRKNIVKNTKASSTSSSVSRIELCTYVTCTLSPHQLQSSNDPISSSLCNDNCAHCTIAHCTSDQQTHTRKELASGFPDKAFYYPRQTGFSFAVY